MTKDYSVIIFYSGQYILVQERYKPTEPGKKYFLWGGKIDSGETPEQALRRELKEELGLEKVNFTYWQLHTFRKDNNLINMHTFISSITPEILNAKVDEGKSVVKMNIKDATINDGFHFGDLSLLRKFKNYLETK